VGLAISVGKAERHMKILHIADIGFYKGGISHALHQSICNENDTGEIDSCLMTISKNIVVPEKIGFSCVLFDKANMNGQIKGISPDIAIFHSFYKLEYLLLARVLKKKNIAYLIKPHGAFSMSCRKKSRNKKRIADIFAFNRFLRGAAGIIYLNLEERKNSYVDARRNYYLPNGIIPDAYDLKTRKTDVKTIRLLFLGRIDVYHKGIDLLMEGLSIINKKKLDYGIEVDIYGGKDKRTHTELIKMAKRRGLKEIIKFHDWVSGEDKEKVFLESDIFILTSRYEGMPMGVLEAISKGMPCLLSEYTNMAEMLSRENAGWKVDMDPKRMAEDILEGIRQFRERPEFWQRNAYKLGKRMNWGNLMPQYIDTYSQIIRDAGFGVLKNKI